MLPATPVADPGGDGVIVVRGDGIVLELVGELRGAPSGTPGDQLTGVGIRIEGKCVTVRSAKVHGYRVGIHALEAHELVLEDCDVSGNFRQRLRSTREQESNEDWLDPHHNDAHEWFTNYGAGIYVEESIGVKVRRSRARAGQNGLVLDRCKKAQIYDNDFSFLSGWGIALWRSSDNVITHNATDFCIRGYVHGVYNRGQDSAGILLFEQCSRNVIAGNSATHCGDGFFAFAGQEALGGVPPPTPDFDYTRRGNNENKIYDNDFSYAAAHGLELTFSFGNEIVLNRLVGNAICGIWAGYSRETKIILNHFEANGDAGYGLERGGVNIEHGQSNRIEHNDFVANRCGVHLWWDADEHLAKLPWTVANGHESKGEEIRSNHFLRDELAIQVRDSAAVLLANNRYEAVQKERDPTDLPETVEPPVKPERFALEMPGSSKPRGARGLVGRDKIVVDEWGPVEPPAPK
ncbi:MAG: right-handed parallel beta-helix repeat-containing protein [Planctomycetota bacterium]